MVLMFLFTNKTAGRDVRTLFRLHLFLTVSLVGGSDVDPGRLRLHGRQEEHVGGESPADCTTFGWFHLVSFTYMQ